MNVADVFDVMALNDIWDYLLIAFFVTFFIQLFFYIGIFSKLAFYKQKKTSTTQQIPVSVIICAKNERENLLEFLPLYLEQDYLTFEIIVVNDHSVDDTKDVLKAFCLQHKKLSVVDVPDNDQFFGSKKYALTLGIKAAKYEHVLLTDADCKPASNQWIRLMTNYSRKKKIVLGFGAYEKKKGLLNKLIRFETCYTAMQYLSFALAKKPYMGVGRNLAYKTELFFKNKGFASHQHILSGDDDLFVNEVGTKYNTAVVIDKSAHTISKVKTTFKAWVRQKRRHFLSGMHYKLKHKLILGVFQGSQFSLILIFVLLMIKVRFIDLIVTLLLLHYLIKMLIFSLSINKLGEKGLFLLFPIFELFFMFFNPLLVLSNFLKKNVKWS